MNVEPIPAKRIAAEWHWIRPLLAKAIRHVKQPVSADALLSETLYRLRIGQYELAKVEADKARGVVVSELCTLDGVDVCWLPFIAGKTGMGPKAFVAFMRAMMGQFEDMARAAGAEEIRIGGRDWSRVFPDFERFDDVPNRLRKRL